MAKIILSMEGMVLKDIPLIKERTTIGRKPHNDIQIDNLAISGEHAVIVLVHNDAFLEDANSTNGTHVNGQPVRKHFLQNGDVIELGKYRLKYINDVPTQTTSDEVERTKLLHTGAGSMRKSPPGDGQGEDVSVHTQTATGWQAGASPTASRSPEVQVTRSVPPLGGAPAASELPYGAIQILSGANAGKEMELTKTLSTLGKPGVQVAVIVRRPHGYFITHVEGANFPVVNGIAIDAQAHPLNDHDIIELAGVKMEFFFKG